VIYRHPVYTNDDIETFGKAFQKNIYKLNLNNKIFYGVGDYNFILLKTSMNNGIRNYADDLKL